MSGSQEDGMRWQKWRRRTTVAYRAHGLDADTAEDLAGEVVLRLLQAESQGAVLSLSYWRATVRSVHEDHLRHLRVVSRGSDLLMKQASVELRVDAERDALRRLWYEECLACLTPEEQHIVRAYLEEQYTFEEIASQMGCRADRVRKSYQRAIAKLRKRELEARGG